MNYLRTTSATGNYANTLIEKYSPTYIEITEHRWLTPQLLEVVQRDTRNMGLIFFGVPFTILLLAGTPVILTLKYSAAIAMAGAGYWYVYQSRMQQCDSLKITKTEYYEMHSTQKEEVLALQKVDVWFRNAETGSEQLFSVEGISQDELIQALRSIYDNNRVSNKLLVLDSKILKASQYNSLTDKLLNFNPPLIKLKETRNNRVEYDLQGKAKMYIKALLQALERHNRKPEIIPIEKHSPTLLEG